MNNKARLFVPGPVKMDMESLEIGGLQSPYARTEEFSVLLLDCARWLKKAVETAQDTEVFFLCSSGTGAMEAAVINCFDENDRLLIIDGGTFGHRFVEICRMWGIPHAAIQVSYGESFDASALEKYENQGFTGLLVNACETSSAQVHDLYALSAFCKRNNMLLAADVISLFMVDPFEMDDMGVDITIMSSQKGLALAPGLSMVLCNSTAMEKVQRLPAKSLYFDFRDYSINNPRGQTPFTPAIPVLMQLHEKLPRVLSRGVDAYIQSCRTQAEYFREGISRLSLEYPRHIRLSSGVTPVFCPEGVDAREIVRRLKDEYEIYVTPSPGVLTHTMFRVSHMGGNLGAKDFDALFDALERLLA